MAERCVLPVRTDAFVFALAETLFFAVFAAMSLGCLNFCIAISVYLAE
jgi:hypothetical protein